MISSPVQTGLLTINTIAKYFGNVSFLKLNTYRYFVLGLPTGSTPLSMYRNLIQFYKEGKVSFEYVKTFNMDEYVGK